MHFDPDKKTISALLSAKKQYEIPRFQREYSWGKLQLNEFLDDIVKRINLVNNALAPSEYFWGTMLFIGNYQDAREKKMEVVDGQQRLTTITIFLSVLSKIFMQNEQVVLSDRVWEYVMSKDDNSVPFAILLNETPNPYFQRLVQKIGVNDIQPITEEEIRIKEAYDFFVNNLKQTEIKKRFDKNNNYDISGIAYIEVIKTIRDQLLNSVVICLCTTDKSQSNMIFEILNAKGLTLDAIDLIKNKIFSIMLTEAPSDEAKLNWKKIKDNLSSRNALIDLSTFFRHYWVSTYSKKPEHKLYEEFLKLVTPKNGRRIWQILKKTC